MTQIYIICGKRKDEGVTEMAAGEVGLAGRRWQKVNPFPPWSKKECGAGVQVSLEFPAPFVTPSPAKWQTVP